MLNWVQVWAPAGLLKNIQGQRNCPKTTLFFFYTGHVLRVIVLLEEKTFAFRCLLVNSRWAIMCLLLRSGFHLATLQYRPLGGVL